METETAMKKEIIYTDNAPKAIGPYSVGVRAGNLIFTSGQLGLDPITGELIPGGIEFETEQSIKNLKNVLQAAGCGLENVVKTIVFLRDINDFTRMNGVYAKFFTENFPARSTVQAAALPKGAAVEIEAIAYVE
jgi:2-iminobutanoate/2-iminopropanoate deaminase